MTTHLSQIERLPVSLNAEKNPDSKSIALVTYRLNFDVKWAFSVCSCGWCSLWCLCASETPTPSLIYALNCTVKCKFSFRAFGFAFVTFAMRGFERYLVNLLYPIDS